MTFEIAMEKLEKIAEKLEEGKLALNEALKLYEEAVELCAFCKKELDQGNGKLVVLREKISGLFEEEDFEV